MYSTCLSHASIGLSEAHLAWVKQQFESEGESLSQTLLDFSFTWSMAVSRLIDAWRFFLAFFVPF